MILPSILTADILNLKEDITRMCEEGIEYLHIDVMDGKFVSDITFGHKIIKDIKNSFAIKCDAHLMVKHPQKQIGKFIEAGADSVTVHVEACDNIMATINKIKDKEIRAGISINPDTDIMSIDPYLDEVDMVLVMSVYPGKGGQVFIEDSLDKIRYLAEYKKYKNLSFDIEVDGGIKAQNIQRIKDAGATMFVVGSALYPGGKFELKQEWEKYIK